jgi:hypothetical protein
MEKPFVWDQWNIGLVPQLSSKRIGNAEREAQTLVSVCKCLGTFFALISITKEENRRYFSYTVEDNIIQVLQNEVNKLLTNADYNAPTADPLQQTDSLSILLRLICLNCA